MTEKAPYVPFNMRMMGKNLNTDATIECFQTYLSYLQTHRNQDPIWNFHIEVHEQKHRTGSPRVTTEDHRGNPNKRSRLWRAIHGRTY